MEDVFGVMLVGISFGTCCITWARVRVRTQVIAAMLIVNTQREIAGKEHIPCEDTIPTIAAFLCSVIFGCSFAWYLI